MKITKYIHSCLLIKDQDKTILLDPDEYTYSAKIFDLNKIDSLDAIGITHEHPDHFSITFLKEILAKFPSTEIFSNESIKHILTKENIKVDTAGNEFIQMTTIPHEKIMGREKMEENVQIDVFNKLTHPGDSLSFTKVKEILALPITAPWGSLTWAAEKAISVKPKYIIPIHDYMLKDDFRKNYYKWLEEFFNSQGIKFFPMENGETLEVN